MIDKGMIYLYECAGNVALIYTLSEVNSNRVMVNAVFEDYTSVEYRDWYYSDNNQLYTKLNDDIVSVYSKELKALVDFIKE